MYQLFQYLLKLPEIIIYILLGVSLSTLIRNTAIANIITVSSYLTLPIIMEKVNEFITMDFVKYLPFSNFNLIDKVFEIEKCLQGGDNQTLLTMPAQYSVFVLSLTAIILLITALDSFNKRDN